MGNENNNTYLKYHITITSNRSLFDVNLKEIWMYRDLIVMFTKKDFSLIYKQTVLGLAWIFAEPFITTVIYAFVVAIGLSKQYVIMPKPKTMHVIARGEATWKSVSLTAPRQLK